MSDVARRLAAAAFAGFVIWFGAASAPASASEAATAIAPPNARLGEMDACRIVAPQFTPMASLRAPLDAVRFVGGAKLRFLVATPCPQVGRDFDI